MWDIVLACAFLVLLWTMVGHLLWCLFAWLIRLAAGTSKPADTARRLCPACETGPRRWTTAVSGVGGTWRARSPGLTDIRAMWRRIQRLANAGRLTAAQLVEFHAVLGTREAELRRATEVRPVASPVAPPAVEPKGATGNQFASAFPTLADKPPVAPAPATPARPPSPAIPAAIGTEPDVRLEIVDTPPVAAVQESLLAPAARRNPC